MQRQTDNDNVIPEAGSSLPYVPKLHMINNYTRHRNNSRVSSSRAMQSPTVIEAIKSLASELPIYNKRNYRACERMPIALSYTAYLERKVAAYVPDNAFLSKKAIFLISEFNLDQETEDRKENFPDVTTGTSREVDVQEIKVDEREDTQCSLPLQDCSEMTEIDVDLSHQMTELFPELQQFPQQDIHPIISQWHDAMSHDVMCCCPHQKEQDKLCKAVQNKRPRDTSQISLVRPKMMIKKSMNSQQTKYKGEEKMKANANMTPGELKLQERAQYIQLVLSRMESAVKVARTNFTMM